MAVLFGITDLYQAAIRQFDTSRTLDLQEKQIHRIFHPEQLAPLQCSLAVVNFGAIVIGYDALTLQSAAQAQPLQLRVCLTQINGQHVVWHCIQRIAEAIRPDTATHQSGFVVTGNQAM